jgi:pSer/pThr/pTyr-binding forkhead associated (FHA) protein
MIKNKSKNNKFIIGRHPNSDVQINDYSISRKQAYIYADEEGNWVI